MWESVVDFFNWLRDQGLALGILLFNYEETKVDRAKATAEDLRVKLQVKENHENVDKANSGKSDLDIVNDAIIAGGGSPIKPDSDGEPGGSGDSGTGGAQGS